ncbi:autotransporter, partial [Mesorhizobium sp. M7A.F.Ca.CA.001.16.1.1]
DGDDTFDMTGGTLAGAVSGGAGNDVITLRGGTINSFLEGNDGNDQILVSGGVLAGEVTGDVGDDLIVISGGAIGSSVSGGAGFDNVSVTGGTITGGIDAEHVHLSGGTIGGNITGLGPDTLVIDGIGAVDPLNLSDGVLFSGTGANGTITGTDLAAGGKSQNFTGFDNFSSDNSTLRFSGGTQGINHLNLGSGSTLFINGNVTMPGSIIATNSLIDMTNGVAGDVLTLGGLTLNGASIG